MQGMMKDPGTSFMGQEIIKYLDELASSDPNKYKDFIKDTLKGGKEFFQEAMQNGEALGDCVVTPKWSIKCPLPNTDMYVNVCASHKMEPYDAATGEVPLFMSPMVADQVDIVVHTDVLRRAESDGWWKQDLQNLFIATLMDQHDVRVRESLCKLQPARKSILKKEVAEKDQSVLETLTSLGHNEAGAKEEDGVDSRWKMLGGHQADTEPLLEERPAVEKHQKPLIQEVKQEPEVTETSSHVNLVVPVECESVKDLELTIKSNVLRLQVGGTTQDITLPTVVRDTDYTAKFLKKKQVLKLAFEKLQ
mmetsp:Transcript_116558/g.202771  ORF Transcript_116558/g.202771 Transcript_116558/m.202771 type:complete len:306 (-) Transcript_116558:1697-2614(-)